jgi:hypothetical protein
LFVGVRHEDSQQEAKEIPLHPWPRGKYSPIGIWKFFHDLKHNWEDTGS